MPERRRPAETKRKVDWNIDQITEVLGTSPLPVSDHRFGDGLSYRLGSQTPTDLAIYRDKNTVMLKTPEMFIGLQPHDLHLQLPIPGQTDMEGSLTFERTVTGRQYQLVVFRDGSFQFASGSQASLQERQILPQVSQPRGQERLPLPGPANQPAATAPLEQEKQPRLQVTGRLGRDPEVRQLANGNVLARFPLAVQLDAKTTQWHNVVLFGERAQRLVTKFKKGDRAEVIGYEHVREARLRDGSTRLVKEIYAAVVKSPNSG